ncbi:uncharacterized protein N7469_004610 [Penicillium citrinum]|uniref:Xylanolytic transcriptional activator regulatory domain-containing protein n=1 Tax=Penicillium citrinum TaxID=5077 RepID=A0A9W9P505_PENCI|nr:uncharacterized protein N7469_004610 [Penicillium citrinum]KAJ5235442.1 hypothetical protein N7469_004610 [Penicillium citrinum]
MSILPDSTEMWNDPILSIEVLALVALYLYSLDMRDSSCCYIGQAMRMALIEGLHHPLPVELEPKLADRWTSIWWSVYILDNKFSASVGVPSSVRDETVTAPLWDPMRCDKEKIGISLHVKVTQTISRVLSSVYSVETSIPNSYLRKAQAALSRLADLSREWEEVFEKRFHSSADAASEITPRLNLSYHLCVIIIVRPLILSLMVNRLENFAQGSCPQKVSSSVWALIEACVDSANKSLKILSVMHDKNVLRGSRRLCWYDALLIDGILENFIPFDLENIFASLFTVKAISAIFPQKPLDINLINSGRDILEDLILRGNRTAQFRKAEIEILESLIALIPTISGLHQPLEPFQTNRLLFDAGAENLPPNPILDPAVEDCTNRAFEKTDALLDNFGQCADEGFGIFDASDGVGLLSNQVLSVINQLTEDDLRIQEDANCQDGTWLWDAS